MHVSLKTISLVVITANLLKQAVSMSLRWPDEEVEQFAGICILRTTFSLREVYTPSVFFVAVACSPSARGRDFFTTKMQQAGGSSESEDVLAALLVLETVMLTGFGWHLKGKNHSDALLVSDA